MRDDSCDFLKFVVDDTGMTEEEFLDYLYQRLYERVIDLLGDSTEVEYG